MPLPERIFKIKGVIQHYSWGGYEFIPELLGIKNEEGKPYAEYWMGAHPNHPAITEHGISLIELISKNAEFILGETVVDKFNSLPYLFKVLDVRQMLSIQVHPSKQSAEKGFEEEEQKGIPLNAKNRNYKDKNHKPELMVALSDFWLLHGFKKEEKLIHTLDVNPELQFLKDLFGNGNYKRLYEGIMVMGQEEVNKILKPLLERIVPLYKSNVLKKDEEHFWAARAAVNFCKAGDYDRGIFSIYFFNLLHLQKGEGIFQASGLPHAYLEGQNAEVMANSDNVLRAGLTDKYIDVNEVMKHLRFEPTVPAILKPASDQKIFQSPAEEFELHQYILKSDENLSVTTNGPEILFILDGRLTLNEFEVQKGESFFVGSNTKIFIKAIRETVLFRVVVPGV